MALTPGFVKFERITPKYKEATFKGSKILQPGKSASGEFDSNQIIHGRVVECGLAANRNSIEPFVPPAQEQMQFPLKPGTWFKARNSVTHRTCPHTETMNTWDVLETFTTRPDWAPED